MLDLEKFCFIKTGNLTLFAIEFNNLTGIYEFSLKYNTYNYYIFSHINGKVYLEISKYKIKLISDEQIFLHKKYPKVKRIRKKINEYIQKYSLIKVRDRKLKKLLNEN